MGAQLRIARHEQIAHAVVTRLRQIDALTRHFLAEEAIWNLHQNASAIAHQRIGTDRTAMGEVFQHLEAAFHDLMRLLALHMRNETNAARIMFIARIIKSLRCGQTRRFRFSRRSVGSGRRSFDRSVLYVVRNHSRYRWRQMRHRHSLRLALIMRCAISIYRDGVTTIPPLLCI